MRKKILEFEEIDMYFHMFISDEEGMGNLISNLGKIHKTISEELYSNIKHLFDICYRTYGIGSYKNIISLNFGRKIIR